MELSIIPIEELIAELKRRNLSFIIGYCDHNEFNKNKEEGIVWGCDAGGNLILQMTLLQFLTRWLSQIEKSRTQPGFGGDQ